MTFTAQHHKTHAERYFKRVKLRGSGTIAILQPGVANWDYVNQDWLKQHKSDLPPGTIIQMPGSAPYTMQEKP